jgi:hypothetical protein
LHFVAQAGEICSEQGGGNEVLAWHTGQGIALTGAFRLKKVDFMI